MWKPFWDGLVADVSNFGGEVKVQWDIFWKSISITAGALLKGDWQALWNALGIEAESALPGFKRAQREILEAIGEDPDRPGLKATPERVADAYAEFFDGQSYLAPISTDQVPVVNVTFEPGCRNHWHIHHATAGGGQELICVAGRGWYQEYGKPAQEILHCTVIHIPANVKHWHGDAKDSWFAHLAFEIPGENTSNEWQEAVSDEEYNKIK